MKVALGNDLKLRNAKNGFLTYPPRNLYDFIHDKKSQTAKALPNLRIFPND